MDNEIPIREPSRSAKKRAAQAVEDVARQLVEMPETEMARLPAAEDILTEIRQARSTRSRGARRRQTKHLAAVLRRHEEVLEALKDFLDGNHARQYEEKEAFHRLEKLRDRLCQPETFAAALEESVATYPDLDRDTLERQARSVHADGDRKAFREIFRQLRKARDRARNA